MKSFSFTKTILAVATAVTFAGVNVVAHADDTTQQKLDAINTKIQTTESKVAEGQKELAKLQAQQYEKSTEIQKLQKNIDARSKQLAKQARAAQLNDTGSMLEFITNSNSLSDAIGRTVTVATMIRANNQTLADQKADQEKVAAAKKAVDKAAADQETTNKQLQNDMADLAVQRTQLAAQKASEDEAAKKAAEEAQKKAEEAAKQVKEAKDAEAAQKALATANEAAESVSTTNDTQTASASSSSESTLTVTTTATTTATAATSSASSTTQTAVPASNYGSVTAYAQSFIGVPYVWGGSTPAGFDCSGLVQYVYAQFGKSLPRATTGQEYAGTQISVEEAQPGDLYFWGSRGSTYHVAIALGGGSFVHAPQPGENVKIGSVSSFRPSFAVRLN